MIGFTSRFAIVVMLLFCCIPLSAICNAIAGSDVALPSRAERLRGLAEVWGIAHFFHPALDDPALQDAWRTAAMHAMAAVDAAETTEEYARALQKLVAYLGDSVTQVVWTEDLGNRLLPPIRLQYIDGRTIVRSIGDEALAHLIGIELLEVDGQSVAAFLDEMWPFAPGETDALKREWIYDELLGGSGGETHSLLLASSDGSTTSQAMSVETVTDVAARIQDVHTSAKMTEEDVLWARVPSMFPFEYGSGYMGLDLYYYRLPPASIYEASAVILDFRTAICPFSMESTSREMFPQLLHQFVPSGGIRATGVRLREHRGYEPLAGHSIYGAGWRTENGPFMNSGYARDMPIVCLVDSESYTSAMPYIAPLQEAGVLVVMGEQFGAMPVTDAFQCELPGGLTFSMRLSIPDVRGDEFGMTIVSPSRTPGADPALGAALETIANWDDRGHNIQTTAPQLGTPLVDCEFTGWSHGPAATRLFGLFELWNTIRYFYAYPELIDGDWSEILEEYIEAVCRVSAQADYARVLQELLVRINDGHGMLLGHYWGGLTVPHFEIAEIEGETATTSLLPVWTDAGTVNYLQPGQVILEVNGVPADDVLENALAISPGARMEHRVFRAHDLAKWCIGQGDLELLIRNHADEELLVDVCRECRGTTGSDDPDPWWIESGIAYLDICSLELRQYQEIEDEIRATNGLIIDLRGYPTSGMFDAVAELVFSEPTTYLQASIPVRSTPDPAVRQTEVWLPKLYISTKERFEGPIVVLTDVSATSAAETMCMFLQDDAGATLVGETTSGTNGNVTEVQLPFNLSAIFSGMAIHHVDGRSFQGIGIIPDIEVHPTIQGIREGRDEVLEKGLEVLQEMMAEQTGGA